MGIIENMSNEEYHSQNGISSTAVKSVFKKSLAHWKGEKRRQTAAFSMGSAVHALLLEEDRDLVIKGPKTRKSKGFTELEENAGPDQIVLTEVEYHVAHRMATETLKNPVCKKALRHKDRQNEVSIFSECERTGLVLKTRPDLYIPSEGAVYDVKTTQDASPIGFAKECWKYSYDIQAAFYIYTCRMAGISVDKFKFIAVEKAAPYASHTHIVSPNLLDNATENMHKVLATIKEATDKEDFGTGWGEYSILELPKWR